MLSFAIFCVQQKIKKNRTFKVSRKNVFVAFLIALALGAFQFFNTYANSFIDAIILVPSVNGLATVLQMISGRIIFREKFTAKQICAICIGIAAILLISS